MAETPTNKTATTAEPASYENELGPRVSTTAIEDPLEVSIADPSNDSWRF